MTAHDFIAQLYSRAQHNVAGNMRYITAPQFELLRKLIAEDPEGGAIKSGLNGGLVWMPAGCWKYALSYDPVTERRSLTRIAVAIGGGTLFG